MSKRYSLMRCRECGFPRLVSIALKWNDNGTITQARNPDFRAVIHNFGFLDNLFSNIEERLGVSIGHIAFEAQRNASKAVIGALFGVVPGARFSRRFDFFKRQYVEQFNKIASLTGQCRSETIEYIPGMKAVGRITNPFHLNLVAAIVVGAFEALEDAPFDYTWKTDGVDTYVITIERAGRKPEIAERMELKYPTPLPGNRVLEKCTRCRVPRELSHLKWLENEGIVLDTRTGARVLILDGYLVTTVFREMARELGEEVNELLVDAQRQLTAENVELLGITGSEAPVSAVELERTYRRYLDMLPLYGQGNPTSFHMEGSRLTVTVENPYEPYIIAGTLQGLYEAMEKSRSEVSWEETWKGSVTYTVEPD